MPPHRQTGQKLLKNAIAGSRSARRRSAEAGFHESAVFEALEPRILLSADGILPMPPDIGALDTVAASDPEPLTPPEFGEKLMEWRLPGCGLLYLGFLSVDSLSDRALLPFQA